MRDTIKLLFFLLIISSCNTETKERKETNYTKIEISTSDLNSKGKLSDLVQNIRILPLETVKESLIKEIKKIESFNGFYYIFDEINRRLYKFNDEGKFICQIGKLGDGPGEFIEPHDFEINKEKRTIWIGDIYAIHEYTLDGSFIKTYKTDFLYERFAIDKNSNDFHFYTYFPFQYIITDSNFKITKELLKWFDSYRVESNPEIIQEGNNILCQLPETIDTIYLVEQDTVKPKYVLDFGEYAYNHDYIKTNNALKSFNHYLLDGCNCITCFKFIPTKNNIFMQLRFSKNVFTGFYNLHTKNARFVNHNKMENDIFSSFFYFNPKGIHNNELIVPVPAYKIYESSAMEIFNNSHDKNIIKNLDENSNPVLLFVELKEI